MRISYNAEVDALYIRFIEGTHQCKTVRVTDDVTLDFGEKEILVGIEILDATKTLGGGAALNTILERNPVIQN